MNEATQQWRATSQPARVFCEFPYKTKKTKKGGWDREAARGGEKRNISTGKRIHGLW